MDWEAPKRPPLKGWGRLKFLVVATIFWVVVTLIVIGSFWLDKVRFVKCLP